MTGILIHVDDVTERRLHQIANELRREVRELAECEVAEAALEFFRGRPIDSGLQAQVNHEAIQ